MGSKSSKPKNNPEAIPETIPEAIPEEIPETTVKIRRNSCWPRILAKTNKKGRPSTLVQLYNSHNSYKIKCEDYRIIFANKGIPPGERLIADFSCAYYYYADFLLQGRIYITQHYFAFHAYWVGMYEKRVIIKCSDIKSIDKAFTLKLLSNAIYIPVEGKTHYFTTFGSRDQAHAIMTTVWNGVLEAEAIYKAATKPTIDLADSLGLETASAFSTVLQPVADGINLTTALSNAEMWSIIKEVYGKHLILNEEDENEFLGVEVAAIISDMITVVEESENTLAKAEKVSTPEFELPAIEVATIISDMSTVIEESENTLAKAEKISTPEFELPAIEVATIISDANIVVKESSEALPKEEKVPTPECKPKRSQSDSVSFIKPTRLPTLTIVPATCPCSKDHYSSVILDRQFTVNIDSIFELIFKADGSNQFQDRFFCSRQTNDLQLTEWATLDAKGQTEVAKSCKNLGTYANLGKLFNLKAIKKRSLQYTVLLNHVMCKSSYTREKQYLLQHEPGRCFVIHSEAKNEGPPYSDSFMINSTWCLTSLGDGCGTRIFVQFKLSWIKSPYSLKLVKGTIEKSSKEGFFDMIHAMIKHMEMEFVQMETDAKYLASISEQAGVSSPKPIEAIASTSNEAEVIANIHKEVAAIASTPKESEAIASTSKESEAIMSTSKEAEAIASTSKESEAITSTSNESEAIMSTSKEAEAIASTSKEAEAIMSTSKEAKNIAKSVNAETEVALSCSAFPRLSNAGSNEVIIVLLVIILLLNVFHVFNEYRDKNQIKEIVIQIYQLHNKNACVGVTNFSLRPECLPKE